MDSTDPGIDALLGVATTAADRAAAVQRRANETSVTAEYKGRSDIVTEIDVDSEHAIRETIEASFPDHAILGEEGGASGDSAYRWVVDPLDGTTNFYHGVPHYGTPVAVERDGDPLVGVINLPPNDRYVATRGGGAYRNGERLSVSTEESLDTALLATGFPPGPADDDLVAAFAAALDASHGVRRIGSAVEDFAIVAEGWLEAYFHASLSPWDRAAGQLLVKEAGGRVTVVGETARTEPAHVVASAPGIHDALCDMVLDHLRASG